MRCDGDGHTRWCCGYDCKVRYSLVVSTSIASIQRRRWLWSYRTGWLLRRCISSRRPLVVLSLRYPLAILRQLVVVLPLIAQPSHSLIAPLFVLRGFHQTMPLPLNAPVTAATAAATAVAAVTATTVVELTIIYCLRKRQQHHHSTSSTTNAKRLTRPDDLDLFNLSTVFEVCDGWGSLVISKLLGTLFFNLHTH